MERVRRCCEISCEVNSLALLRESLVSFLAAEIHSEQFRRAVRLVSGGGGGGGGGLCCVIGEFFNHQFSFCEIQLRASRLRLGCASCSI